jgi:hypothetical protein
MAQLAALKTASKASSHKSETILHSHVVKPSLHS